MVERESVVEDSAVADRAFSQHAPEAVVYVWVLRVGVGRRHGQGGEVACQQTCEGQRDGGGREVDVDFRY